MNTELLSLDGRTVVVTGAAQGIGRAAAALVVRLGGNVVGVDLNGDALRAAMAELPPARALAAEGSVTDAALAAATVDSAVARFGAVHGLVNNAGITRPAMLEKMTLEQWRAVVDVHLTGTFLWTQAVGRHLLARAKARGAAADAAGAGGASAAVADAGSIVNVSSDAGRKGSIGQVNYAAAKAGMLGITMSAAREWGRFGIRVNSVCFGVVETPMTEVVRGEKFRAGLLAQIPLGRWSSADEVVRSIAFLLSDASSYITGQHLGVDGGYHITV